MLSNNQLTTIDVNDQVPEDSAAVSYLKKSQEPSILSAFLILHSKKAMIQVEHMIVLDV